MTDEELILGCGHRRDDRIVRPKVDTRIVTLDINPAVNPDVVHDLNELPLPFEGDRFIAIHARHVLEHVGALGDWRRWFAEWSEYYRVLKPGGVMAVAVPSLKSPFLFGDPGHCRVIVAESFLYLDRLEYARQVDSGMTDYRNVWHGDFERLHVQETDDGQQLIAILKAHKPAR